MTTKKLQYKRDEYRTARGGRSKFIDLSCARCGKHIALYQKDGPGPLKRLYLDRIVGPSAFVVTLEKVRSLKEVPSFSCTSCREEFGIPMIYDKEKRLAYKLFQAVLVAKKHDSTPSKKKA